MLSTNVSNYHLYTIFTIYTIYTIYTIFHDISCFRFKIKHPKMHAMSQTNYKLGGSSSSSERLRRSS